MGKDKIDDKCFKKSSITRIAIPNSITSIGNKAFKYCMYLGEIAIPSSVISIGDCAFYGCTSLTQITIPSTVTSIEDGTFLSFHIIKPNHNSIICNHNWILFI